MTRRLKDKVAIVTGAGRGLGKAFALKYAAEATLMQSNSDEMFAGTIAMQCIKQRQEPDDLVGAAIFLASEESDFVTGQMLIVDGGAAFV